MVSNLYGIYRNFRGFLARRFLPGLTSSTHNIQD